MATVRRANVVLDILDDQVERYMDMGYDVIDMRGNVIRHSVPLDVNTLRKAYVDLTKQVNDQKELIAKQQETIKELEAKLTAKRGSRK